VLLSYGETAVQEGNERSGSTGRLSKESYSVKIRIEREEANQPKPNHVCYLFWKAQETTGCS